MCLETSFIIFIFILTIKVYRNHFLYLYLFILLNYRKNCFLLCESFRQRKKLSAANISSIVIRRSIATHPEFSSHSNFVAIFLPFREFYHATSKYANTILSVYHKFMNILQTRGSLFVILPKIK